MTANGKYCSSLQAGKSCWAIGWETVSVRRTEKTSRSKVSGLGLLRKRPTNHDTVKPLPCGHDRNRGSLQIAYNTLLAEVNF